MHDFLLEYDKTDIPKCAEIVKFTIGIQEKYDPSWVLMHGEVLLRIPCSNGTTIIIRKNGKPMDFYREAPNE